jgi:hypothetical protein
LTIIPSRNSITSQNFRVTERPVAGISPIEVTMVAVCVPCPVNSPTTVSPAVWMWSTVIRPSGNPFAQDSL